MRRMASASPAVAGRITASSIPRGYEPRGATCSWTAARRGLHCGRRTRAVVCGRGGLHGLAEPPLPARPDRPFGPGSRLAPDQFVQCADMPVRHATTRYLVRYGKYLPYAVGAVTVPSVNDEVPKRGTAVAAQGRVFYLGWDYP